MKSEWALFKKAMYDERDAWKTSGHFAAVASFAQNAVKRAEEQRRAHRAAQRMAQRQEQRKAGSKGNYLT